MNALRRALIQAAHQILVDALRHERDHGRGSLACGHKSGVQRHIGVDLILRHVFAPEPFAAAAHVPVAQIIHKLLQTARRLGNGVSCQIFIHGFYHRVHFGQDPFVHHRQCVVFQRIFRSVECIDVGIQHIECIGVPQRTHQLALAFLHAFV